jgi:hypothetical protein
MNKVFNEKFKNRINEVQPQESPLLSQNKTELPPRDSKDKTDQQKSIQVQVHHKPSMAQQRDLAMKEAQKELQTKKYKIQDILKDSGKDIFKVISRRYSSHFLKFKDKIDQTKVLKSKKRDSLKITSELIENL